MNLSLINTVYASETLDQFIGKVNNLIINPIIVLLFALALVFFIYGIVEFISNQDNEEKKTTGRTHMIWGIVGITIMMSVFMLMKLVMTTFDIQGIDPEKGTVNLPPAN